MVKSAVTDLIQCYKIYCLCPTTRFWKGSKLYFPLSGLQMPALAGLYALLSPPLLSNYMPF